MRCILAALFVLLGFVGSASAQSSPVVLRGGCGTASYSVNPPYFTVDTKGNLCITLSGGTSSAPYQFSPTTSTGTDQHNVAVTTATSLTVPTDAICANISTKGGAVNWRWDGTAPTGSTGNGQAQGTMAQFCGRNILTAIQFIQQTGNTSTIDVAYSK